jgi:hypothetical protein
MRTAAEAEAKLASIEAARIKAAQIPRMIPHPLVEPSLFVACRGPLRHGLADTVRIFLIQESIPAQALPDG